MIAGTTKSALLVGNFLSATNTTRSVCEDLADRLSSAGWSVLTTSRKANRLSRLLDMMGTVWRERDRYAAAQVDVFSGAAFTWAEVVCWMLGRIRKPLVLTLHGGNLPAFAERWPGRVRRLLSCAAVVTVPSRYLHEEMKSYRADLQLLPNPLDVVHYPFRLRSHPRPRLIWLRAFHRTYNPSLIPRLLAELRIEYPSLEVIMIGPDKHDGSLEETRILAAELGVSNRIMFPGGISKREISQWMNKGDIFLNTSQVDNTPISVIEAMACGLCVVSTNVGGIPYLLENNFDALLVPANDPAAMAGAVRRILTVPELAAQLSLNARRKVEQFDWSITLKQWEAVLGQLVTPSPKPIRRATS